MPIDGKPVRDEFLIVSGGTLAGAGAHSYAVAPTAGAG